MDLAKISGRSGLVGSYRAPSTSPVSPAGPSTTARVIIKNNNKQIKYVEDIEDNIVKWI